MSCSVANTSNFDNQMLASTAHLEEDLGRTSMYDLSLVPQEKVRNTFGTVGFFIVGFTTVWGWFWAPGYWLNYMY